MAEVVMQMTGLDEFRRAVAGMLQRAKSKRALYEEAGKIMAFDVIPKVFVARGGPKWSWAPPKYRPGQPLRDTDMLMNSMQYDATDSYMVVGTKLIYGGVHQRGMTIKAKNSPWLTIPVGGTRNKPESFRRVKSVVIPMREFLYWTPAALGKIGKRWTQIVGEGR